MTELDVLTTGLVRLAAAIAMGGVPHVVDRCTACLELPVPNGWVDELMLQSILMVGYPRALAAAHAWRSVAGRPAVSLEDGGDFGLQGEWVVRGEATCRTIYGENYGKLRANVSALHPALDAWMVTEGYGRTLSRPGLDLVRRELCVIAQVTALEAERQLHSHLRGALNAGASRAAIDAVFDAIVPDVGALRVAKGRTLFERIGR